jgi:hypothetical protein
MHFLPAWLLLLVPMLQASGSSGIKMTIRFSHAENSSEQTIYISGDRKRMEFRNSEGQKKANGSLQLSYGPRLVAITRCDLGQTFELNLDASEYTSAPYPPKPLTREQIEARGLQIPATSDKPTLRLELSTRDTGERKEMFGHIARHLVTTRKQIPLAGSRAEAQESVTDAWYVDLNQRLSCDRNWPAGKSAHAYTTLAVNGRHPREKVEFIATGEPAAGFVLQSVMTSKLTYVLPDGTRKQTDSRNELLVTKLEEGPLGPGLFEIPPGFRHVDHIERNPRSASRMEDLWQRFKAGVASFFNL